ncbi:hypothetical protein [Pararhizobium gei]|uniref:hypothetical protein n=1 Tax=Pararhizobium gei TaxID=1395951 RepID=UPI0023DC24C4|nr:hypothetical protein [Rhizobium gei]
MTDTGTVENHGPLISARFICTLTAIVVGLAVSTAGLSVAGRWYGENLALAGHTTSVAENDIFIGQDHLRLPSNAIRFEGQRATGLSERVDLYLTWPDMNGYTDETRALFNDVSKPDSLIFLEVSQSTMSRDMSGRLEPIYRHLFDGAPSPGPAGLTRHSMKANSGYGAEVFFTAPGATKALYAVRCLIPDIADASTSADCQRDIHAGSDLVVLYRFSSQLLPQWQAIDAAVLDYINGKLVR